MIASRFLAVFFVGLTALSLMSAERAIELPSDWAKGTVKKFDVIRERETTRDGTKTVGATRTPLTIEIIEKSDSGYKLTWTLGHTEILAPNPAEELQIQVANATAGFKLLIQTDNSGTPDRLLNREEVARTAVTNRTLLEKWLKKSGLPDSTVKKAIADTEALVTADRLESHVLKDPHLFFLVSGGSFALGDPHKFEDQLPNPLTNKRIPVKAEMALKQIISDEATVEFSQRSKPENGPTAFTLEDRATYVMDLKTGWPKNIQHERRTTFGDVKRSDRIKFLPVKK